MENSLIESGRAEFALIEVKSVLADSVDNEDEYKEYKSYCRKFPSMVQTNGLAAAIAFAHEKNGTTWECVYGHSEKWLKKIGMINDEKNLIDYVCELGSTEYRVVTKEILALFNWIRRFAAGL